MKPFLHAAGRGLGALACSVACLLWLYALYVPNAAFSLNAMTIIVSVLMTIASIMGAIASVKGHSNVMLVMFLVSFLPVGAYMIRTDHWLSWVGVCNLALLAASFITRWSKTDDKPATETS